MNNSPLAGTPATQIPKMLINVPRLITQYFSNVPDAAIPTQRIAFGTSGHRGSAAASSFNEAHIRAVTQAICLYRAQAGITGPLFIGKDTHALSEPAFVTALEVLAGNQVTTMIDEADGYTPTPVISHAILSYNAGRSEGLADGIVITPSHNPPGDGGFKYNPPSGGPADVDVTNWVEKTANDLLAAGLVGTKRMPYARALKSAWVKRYDYAARYVAALDSIVDLVAIKASGIKIGIDPLGGTSLEAYQRIIERYGIDATIVNDAVDPTFGFMTLDWDGKIRMDCSSPFAMRSLVTMADKFDLAFANDPDADRHGIVCRGSGLMNPNHYLTAAIAYLVRSREGWRKDCEIGKTIVSSSMIDKVTAQLGRKMVEVPVGFKWFVAGLQAGTTGFAGEESAGASFLKKDGTVWTTDKDGIILCLLAAEMLAKTGKDPAQHYAQITAELGEAFYERIDVAATLDQKKKLKELRPEHLTSPTLAGDPITQRLIKAPGNDQPFGGMKVITDQGWFAVRGSGTEDVYKIYAESLKSPDHLRLIQQEAEAMIGKAIGV